ncbi:hypothetical protein EHN07_04270 [Buttiauxella warmboldiae]|uniref:Uncharacterized protein n=1 Tax=Buttiauxella warmboldiae TaxID=82993 RepID=A0A3N5EBT3_9ENTR|nr:hypothetical protein [Buttiauxella warmboldiae]RPH29923.1 hypothetical protein EHN07_04270 [Buttiauxella warmboldiae]
MVQPENIILNNPFKSRVDLRELVSELLNTVSPLFKKDASRIDLLISAILAGDGIAFEAQSCPQAIISEAAVRLVMGHQSKLLSLESHQ